MKEHFDDYEERIRNFLEEGEEEMDAALGEMFDSDAVEFPETLDEKIYTKIRGVNERMDANSTGENGDCEETEDVAESGMPDENVAAATMPDGNAVATTVPDGNAVAATMPDENAVAATMSDEDAEALRLGKELQERRKAEDAKRAARRKFAPWKRVAAAVLAVAVIGCIGVQSQGGAEKVVEKLTEKHGFREEEWVSSSKDDVKGDSEEGEEQAYEQVRERLGIEPVRVCKIKGMNYLSCEVEPNLRTATLFYEYNGYNLSFVVNGTYTEDVWGISYEDSKADEYLLELPKKDVHVERYVVSGDDTERWVAELEHQGAYYCLMGRMRQEDFEEILKNLFFP